MLPWRLCPLHSSNACGCLLCCAFHSAFRINSIAIRLIDEIERKRSMHKTWTIILVAIPSVVCFKTLIYGTLNQLSFFFFHAIRVCLFSFSCWSQTHTHTPIESAKIKNMNLMNGRSTVAHANTHTPFRHTKHEVNYSVNFSRFVVAPQQCNFHLRKASAIILH